MHIRDYIQATYEVLQKEGDTSAVFKNLQTALQKRGLLKMYPRILRGLIPRIGRSEERSTPTVVVAREKDSHTYKQHIETALAELTGTHAHGVHIDPTIIGGFIVKGKSKRIDHSYKNTLLHTYHRLTD